MTDAQCQVEKYFRANNDQMKAQEREWMAWSGWCMQYQKMHNMTAKEFNACPEVKHLVKLIERWAYFEHMRRKAFNDDKPEGMFWKGD